MNQGLNAGQIVASRLVFFSADILLILIILALVSSLFASAIGIMAPHLAFLVLDYYDQFMYVIPVLGIAWLYNRFRSRRTHSAPLVHLRINFLENRYLSSIAFILGFFASVIVALDNSILAGAGLFGGALVACGSGAALKHCAIGNVHDRTQLIAALASALALIGSSWLASWAYVTVDGIILPGGYIAPLLGLISGLFVPLEPSDTQDYPQTTHRT